MTKRHSAIVGMALVFLGWGMAAWGKIEMDNSLSMKRLVAPNPQDVTPRKKGDDIPFGTLRTPEGKAVDVEDFLRQKATILLFYQGGWSPSAKAQLQKLSGVEPDLEKLGYQVAAVCPDKPERLKDSFPQALLNFSLLSDRNAQVIRRFGLAYHADLGELKKEGVNLKDYTGNNGNVLPVPAVYGIVQGDIQFVYYYPGAQASLDPRALLSAAQEAAAGKMPSASGVLSPAP